MSTVAPTFDEITVPIDRPVDAIARIHPRCSCSPLDHTGVQTLPTRTVATSGLMKFKWRPVGKYAHVAGARFRIGDRIRVFKLNTEVLTDPVDELEISVRLHQL